VFAFFLLKHVIAELLAIMAIIGNNHSLAFLANNGHYWQ
jgi:hypothetical protein